MEIVESDDGESGTEAASSNIMAKPMAGGAEKDACPGSACAARPSVVGRDDHAVPAGSYSDAVLSCCASIYSEGDGR